MFVYLFIYILVNGCRPVAMAAVGSVNAACGLSVCLSGWSEVMTLATRMIRRRRQPSIFSVVASLASAQLIDANDQHTSLVHS